MKCLRMMTPSLSSQWWKVNSTDILAPSRHDLWSFQLDENNIFAYQGQYNWRLTLVSRVIPWKREFSNRNSLASTESFFAWIKRNFWDVSLCERRKIVRVTGLCMLPRHLAIIRVLGWCRTKCISISSTIGPEYCSVLLPSHPSHQSSFAFFLYLPFSPTMNKKSQISSFRTTERTYTTIQTPNILKRYHIAIYHPLLRTACVLHTTSYYQIRIIPIESD